MMNQQAKHQNRVRMPVLFVGHGSPMNIIADDRWSQGFAALHKHIPQTPTAIVAISAHWFVAGTFVTSNAQQKTIHDFSGFPQALYEITYPAPGKVDLAKRLRNTLAEHHVSLSSDWGLDHGTWSVLRWMYPQAQVPVIQLSIDRRLSPKAHYELGRSLAELRDEGVLIMGSGNIVHNLRDAFSRMQHGSDDTPPWAQMFDDRAAQIIEQRDTPQLLSHWPDSEHARMAHPIPDHWLPLLYAYGATGADDAVQFSSASFDLGSISMRNVIWG